MMDLYSNSTLPGLQRYRKSQLQSDKLARQGSLILVMLRFSTRIVMLPSAACTR
ncbi:hypothetical protein L1N85_06735 [Paenibacillus alkaliterrae]|uniref:hypothetical protein n=1 Tax=Paenibacillus alkaliterrae TaxID=320909 RepID=UPI001F2F54D3|nr:hypothetical protein [Paenibacillus alkaliterrae]MCF2938128.1 hypothetical protein [Paenibacillus alkaliterrae]